MKERLAKAPARTESRKAEAPQPMDTDLQRLISEAAYYRAQSRGFEPGNEQQDWLAAEAEILARNRP